MKLPSLIKPDRIRDSIVELRYNSKVPYEIAIGMFFQSLDDSYKYTSRPVEKIAPSVSEELMFVRMENYGLFYNDSIKIQFYPNSIIFNCLSNYITWKRYNPEIKAVLDQILSVEVINHFSRIGVRYISDYENTDLTECVDFNFSFGMPETKSNRYLFRTEFVSDDIKVILNLGNRIPRISQNTKEKVEVSSIDVDTILNVPEITNPSDIMKLIDKVHLKEKEVFFSLLKKDFLESLKPEY